MEFIEFLDKAEVEIIQLVEDAGYKTIENTKHCSLGQNNVGFLNKKKKRNYNLYKKCKKERGIYSFKKKR